MSLKVNLIRIESISAHKLPVWNSLGIDICEVAIARITWTIPVSNHFLNVSTMI